MPDQFLQSDTPSWTTLQNYGVPTSNGQRAALLMPKIKNRFRVTVANFGGFTDTIMFTGQVISAGRPNVSFEPQAVHAYNSVAYYAGKANWETIPITLRDDMTNGVSQLVNLQLTRQMNFFQQTTFASAGDYKFAMWIETLDGGNDIGEALETWYLEGCFITQSNFESFEYQSSDAMTIELTIRFDNATSNVMLNASTNAMTNVAGATNPLLASD
jgi:hypothetical protein